ncbi:MAG: DUF3052 domain-containing protein [Acidimicrobiales bacterium]|nr:DUF3052 domain-containing protein [Acidimicrobiia bacterium]NNC78520.1 DUF3052 domain-containing protein [Acidimicrobiales bacterium]RZV45895.1 MAG: DUF3052 domain-containing protein [Acidimicrobiales bacterium]
MSSAGYSGTPLSLKLGIKEGHTVALIDAPPHIPELLSPLPDDVTTRFGAHGKPNVSLVFCHTTSDLRRRVDQFWRLAFPDRAIWICWPKKSSPLFRDLTEDGIRDILSEKGLVDVKVCAIDEDYSGLKLVVRKELRVNRVVQDQP